MPASADEVSVGVLAAPPPQLVAANALATASTVTTALTAPRDDLTTPTLTPTVSVVRRSSEAM